MLIDRAQLLTLTVPEMTALIGGMRVLGVNYKDSKDGVFTNRIGALTTDFFVNLLDMGTEWKAVGDEKDHKKYEGYGRADKKLRWTASRIDLVFGANSQLRAVVEVYACKGNERKFIEDFIEAWVKVMDLDRYDVKIKK